MINLLASILVLFAGLYFISLAVISWFSPARAELFLSGFANSAFKHYLELVLRFIAGAAFLFYAPQMLFSTFFIIFGWILVVTTVGLFAVPWQWHLRFAQWTVPYATRNLWLVAIASLIFGGFVLASVILGNGTEQWRGATSSLLGAV